MMADGWSEAAIARALAHGPLKGRNLIVVPNCCWTGYEADLLIVTPKLLLVDVEIKISRSDLKADAKKDKWWHRLTYAEYVAGGKVGSMFERSKRVEHPPRVARHYYALPADIWDDRLLPSLASPKSGVILLKRSKTGFISCEVAKRCQADKEAKPISAAAAIDIARLSSYRYWDAIQGKRPRRPLNL